MINALLLGAGASCGTCPSVPVAKDFGRALASLTRYSNGELLEIVKKLDLDREAWSLEDVWTYADYYSKLNRALRPEAEEPTESHIKRALLEVYGERCDGLADALPDGGHYTLSTLVRELKPGDILVSFNYDTIAERLARRLGKLLQPAPRDEVVVASAITLAKPHGSTSWSMHCHGTLDRSAVDGGARYDSLTPNDIKHGRSPLVLGAVPIKSELIKEVQQRAGREDIFETIAMQWRQVVRAVEFADDIVVAGYSFPPQDEYGRFIIREGLRARSQNRRGKLRIRFFETKENEARSALAIQALFSGHISELIPAGPVMPPAGFVGDC